MTSCVTEIFANRCTCKWCVILHGSRVAGSGGHDNGVVHRPLLSEGIDNGGNRRAFLSNSHIDTIDGFPCLVVGTLVDDGVDGDSSLTCLTVSDDEFSLSSTNRNHGVHSFQSCLQRLVHGLTEDDARGFALQRHVNGISHDGTLSINRMSEGVNNTSYHPFTHSDGSDASCTFHDVALLDIVGWTKQHSAHIVFLKVHHDGFHAIVELKEFASFCIAESIGTNHTVTDSQYGTYLGFVAEGVLFVVDVGELLAQHRCHFTYFYGVGHNSFLIFSS